MNVTGAKEIKTYDGWQDFDWDKTTFMNGNGETRIEKDDTGKLKYRIGTWDKNEENLKITEPKGLETVGDYYVIPIQYPVNLEKTESFKGMEVNISLSGDGVDYTGPIGCDDIEVTSSKKVVFFAKLITKYYNKR